MGSKGRLVCNKAKDRGIMQHREKWLVVERGKLGRVHVTSEQKGCRPPGVGNGRWG